jgi:hypothetical protein
MPSWDATRNRQQAHGRADAEGRREPDPCLSKLPGLNGYFLIEAGHGVMSSVNLFDTSAQADESTRVVAEWLREEKLESLVSESAEDHRRRVIVKEMNGAPRV